jgi:hypothetical protein
MQSEPVIDTDVPKLGTPMIVLAGGNLVIQPIVQLALVDEHDPASGVQVSVAYKSVAAHHPQTFPLSAAGLAPAHCAVREAMNKMLAEQKLPARMLGELKGNLKRYDAAVVEQRLYAEAETCQVIDHHLLGTPLYYAGRGQWKLEYGTLARARLEHPTTGQEAVVQYQCGGQTGVTEADRHFTDKDKALAAMALDVSSPLRLVPEEVQVVDLRNINPEDAG